MPINKSSETFFHQGWVFKIFQPVQPDGKDFVILLHGWTGNEKSMDIFVRAFPPHVWIISPRAPNLLRDNAYSWTSRSTNQTGTLTDFLPSASSLWQQIPLWIKLLNLKTDPHIHFVGFSQGGAMALVLSIMQFSQTGKTACLSGYLPELGQDLIQPGSLHNKSFLIIHGSNDHIISVDHARSARNILSEAGASITYCESKVGHKLSAECFNELGKFFSDL